MSATLPLLRMNQGDRTESRIYYLPHFVAHQLDLFRQAGVAVEFVWAEAGDHLAKSGQVPAVITGQADLTIGGPMVTMRMLADGGPRIVNFCAAVRGNPWYLVGRQPEPGFALADLAGRTVIDMAGITTATLCFQWLLAQHDLAERVTVVPGSGDTERDIAALHAGEADYLLHSLHVLGNSLATGAVAPVQELATPTGAVPWSAYIALPERVAARRADFAAFTRAIAGALAWVESHPPAEVAALVAEHYQTHTLAALTETIARYKEARLWPTDALIPRAEFEHFNRILLDIGWLPRPVAYEDQVETDLATEAAASGVV